MKNLQIMPSGYGHYKITINYYGKNYSTISNDSIAIDAYKNEEGGIRMTQRQASLILWEEVKKENNLGSYNY